MKMKKIPPKRRRGNPGKPPGERGDSVNTYLPGPVIAWLKVLGGGSASKGLRLVATEWHHRESLREKTGAGGL